MRFEYAAPDNTLVMAGGGKVAIFDGKSNTGPEQYPLRRTPLSIILARNVNLARADMVVGHREDGDTTVVTAQNPEHPEYGNIQLVFTADPVELRQWIITDGSGGQATVILGDLERDVRLSDRLFIIQQEADSRRRPGAELMCAAPPMSYRRNGDTVFSGQMRRAVALRPPARINCAR